MRRGKASLVKMKGGGEGGGQGEEMRRAGGRGGMRSREERVTKR